MTYNGPFRFMSTDEAREEKAHLLLEHQEAEDELNLLKDQAATLGEAFQGFGKMLAGDPGRKIYVRSQDQYGLPTDQLDEKLQSLNVAAALELADKIRAATRRFNDLTERKSRLHLR